MVSRTTREETLPLYYVLNTFRMFLNHREQRNCWIDGTTTEVITWAKANKVWLKHFRTLLVSRRPDTDHALHENGPATCKIQYKPDEGLRVEHSSGQNHSVNGCCVDFYARDLESFRRVCDLQCQVIPMYFTRRFKIWAELSGDADLQSGGFR